MLIQEIDEAHEKAFLDMLADYREHDAKTFTDLYGHPPDSAPARFAKYLAACRKERMDWRPKAGKIAVTRYVLLDGDGVIRGNARLRFPLTPDLEVNGGNVVFDVPPSSRGQGYGALTLNRMLFEAARAGLARILVTCAADNPAAIRCIEKNRGQLADETRGQRRFWIPLR